MTAVRLSATLAGGDRRIGSEDISRDTALTAT